MGVNNPPPLFWGFFKLENPQVNNRPFIYFIAMVIKLSLNYPNRVFPSTKECRFWLKNESKLRYLIWVIKNVSIDLGSKIESS